MATLRRPAHAFAFQAGRYVFIFVAGLFCGVCGAKILHGYLEAWTFCSQQVESTSSRLSTVAEDAAANLQKPQRGQDTRTYAQQEWQGGFQPDGYALPNECLKHGPLYAAIFDHLRPWFERGITKADLDACHPLAPAGYNISEGTHNQNRLNPVFRLLSWDNEVYVTSGGLERVGGYGQQPLHYHMISQIQTAAQRFGLPNIEFAVAFGDKPAIEHGPKFPDAMCPLFTFAKHPKQLNILIPSGEFIKTAYDDWVERVLKDPTGGVPWEQKEERAVGRWTLFENVHYTDRFGRESQHIRQEHIEHSNATGYKYTSCMSPGAVGGLMALSEQRKFKYTLNTDGFTASVRFAKLLPTGQTVIKQDSQQVEWYYHALKPWVHYVPTGYNGLEEVDRIVQFLQTHDNLAQSIADNSRAFAATHLVSEGRHCYIKVLFEEMHKLMKDRPSSLDDFPSRIRYDDDVKEYLLESSLLDPQQEG